MRTTIRLQDDLMREATQHALKTDRTLTQLIQDALIILMEQENNQQSPRIIKLTTFNGDGVHDGININSSTTLFTHMDSL